MTLNKLILLVYLLSVAQIVHAAQIAQYELHGKFIRTTESNYLILKRLLGTHPPQNWKQSLDHCQQEDQVLCALTNITLDQKSSQLLLRFATENDLYFALDQSKTRQSKIMRYDSKYYEWYMDFPDAKLEKIWSLEELQAIEKVLLLLPPKLKSFKHTKNIYILPDNYFLTRDRAILRSRPTIQAVAQTPTYLDGKLRNEGFIAFFPMPQFKFADNQKTRELIIHEFAHAFDHQFTHVSYHGLSGHSDWWSLSWIKDRHKYYPVDKNLFVSKYAMTSPTEDFAESVAEYFLRPDRLKSLAPAKYAYVQDLFQDLTSGN